MNGEFLFSTYRPGGAATGYILSSGVSPFGNKLSIYPPYYLKSRKVTPAFALIKDGKHISSFYITRFSNWFSGDHAKRGLIIHFKEEEIELWVTPLPPNEMKIKFAAGELGELMLAARRKSLLST